LPVLVSKIVVGSQIEFLASKLNKLNPVCFRYLENNFLQKFNVSEELKLHVEIALVLFNVLISCYCPIKIHTICSMITYFSA
jgi:hypothetical protein